MSFNNSFSAVTGVTYTAAQYNTHTRDNFTAIWVYTTAGDIAYATSATALARLGIGANGYFLESNGSAPQWTQFVREIPLILNADIALPVQNDLLRYRVSSTLNGWNILSFGASRASGSSLLTIQVRRVTRGNVNIMSTPLTIDAGETDSNTAATGNVVNAANDDLQSADQLAVDVTTAGTDTLHCCLNIRCAKP